TTSAPAPADGPPMRRHAWQRSASASDTGIMIVSKDSGPAASIIGSAMLTPITGTCPRRSSATAVWLSARRLAARCAASAPPAVYGPAIMIHIAASSCETVWRERLDRERWRPPAREVGDQHAGDRRERDAVALVAGRDQHVGDSHAAAD